MKTTNFMLTFQETQRQFLAHLRNPEHAAAPSGIEDRRVKVYRDLIYNNVEGFIRGGFPILRTILSDDVWHGLVREFICTHPSTSPYFLDIGKEFLTFLQEHRADRPGDPPFMLELAHYEWVELALDISEEVRPDTECNDLLSGKPGVSPLVWCLTYRYPVHRLGPAYQPNEPPEMATYLVVYRDREDTVKFMESNAVTHRLLQLLQDDEVTSGRIALEQIAQELQAPDTQAIVTMGSELLGQLHDRGILCGA